jgi:hypothetical protein
VDALPGEGVEVRGHRGDEGLSFTRFHLRDEALVQGGGPHHLDVEVALPDGPLGRLADAGERLGQEVLQRLALLHAPAELVGLAPELVVGEVGDLVLERVDQRHVVLEALELSVLSDLGDLAQYQGEALSGFSWGDASEP